MTTEILVFAIHGLLLLGAVGLLLLSMTLSAELVAALALPARRAEWNSETNGSYVVVVPAHNEVGTIERTLATVVGELSGQGRILIVADNCTDDTAAAAEAAGASVIARDEPTRRGKGYAIDFAVRFLASGPPDVVIVLDADCIPDPGALQQLFVACRHLNCPVQARYELDTPDASAGQLARVGAFAWRVKNVLRPTGLARLGVPCLLMGTGMAFPWSTLAGSRLATDHLVEDMALGLELAASGKGPQFAPEACVRSALPPSLEGQRSQRTRWETGHLRVIGQIVPWLTIRAIARGDWRLFALALHTSVPPLALFVLLLTATTVASCVQAALGGPSLAFVISGIATCVAGIVFAIYWLKIGRDLVSIREILQLPGYVVTKIPMYRRAVSGRRVEWIRSKRD